MPATVFTARGDGANLDDANVRHVLKRILEKAELRHIRIDDLRHTFASLLIQNGGEPRVRERPDGGHASIQITVDTYGHLVPAGTARLSIGSMTSRRGNQWQPRRNQSRFRPSGDRS